MKLYLLLFILLTQNLSANSCGVASFTRIIKRSMAGGEESSGLRKQKLSARAAREEFEITDKWEMIPRVGENKLKAVEKFTPNSGTNENYFYKGEIKGKKVFIKTLDDEVDIYSPELMLNEARNYYLMDMLGIGPKFYGTTTVAGKMGVVLENVEGVLVKWGSNPALRQAGITIKPSAIRDMKLAASRLDQAGIHNPYDMQFIISADGKRATLVDPEHFKMVGPPDGARKNVEQVLESLKGYFSK